MGDQIRRVNQNSSLIGQEVTASIKMAAPMPFFKQDGILVSDIDDTIRRLALELIGLPVAKGLGCADE